MNNSFSFEKICFESLKIEEFNNFPNKSVLTTKDWIEFVKEDSIANPYILKIFDGSTFVGYFTSLIVKKAGFKIVGSPFPGWSTPYMGLDCLKCYNKSDILPDLISFVMKDTGCAYLQISDRDLVFEELEKIKIKYNYTLSISETLELKIESDDALQYKKMKNDCRNFIKQFERRGATVEKAKPDDSFAEEYYEQLIDVFAKQDLVPTYTVGKVKCLLRHLSKSGSVLCLRVREPNGKSIATSIFPAFNNKMFFWGGASFRSFQQYRPNEYMIYKAMKYWRERGCTIFDMVGNRAYKKKFGSFEVHYPVVVVSRYRFLVPLKNMAEKLYYFSGKFFWKFNIKR